MRMVAEQIAETNPDIVLLQEVAASLMKNVSSTSHSASYLPPSLTSYVNSEQQDGNAFEALHFPNTQKSGDDYEEDTHFDLEGLGMLWNPKRFELKEFETIKFNPHFYWIYDKKKAEKRCLPSNNVCSLAVFEDKLTTEKKDEEQEVSKEQEVSYSCPLKFPGRHKSKKLIVAGVHFDYRRGHDFQLVQLQHVIEVIRRKHGFDKTCAMCEPVEDFTGVIIMGDYNMNGCTDEVFEKFSWESSNLLPDFTRVEFNSEESEAKIAQQQQADDNSKNNNDVAVAARETNTSTLSKKYPFASTLAESYTAGMWLDHCFYTGTSLQCLQHTGLPTSFESFPILSDTHPSDHVPIAVKLKWR